MLQLCIESIRKNSRAKHQLIVHINEGNDGTLDWVDSQDDIDYTFSENNIGICYSLNIARSLVDTDYVLYMNDDMYVCPGWDMELIKEIEQIGHPDFFLSATMIEHVPGNNCAIFKNYGTGIESFREKELLDEFASLPMQDWQGATWPPNIVHKDVWDMAGGYSTEFSPGMYSDPDFSMKLWKMGIRLYKGVSKSRVYHFGSGSTKRVKKNNGYYTFLSKWGMSPGSFTKYYLRRGKLFDGPLQEPVQPGWIKLKNFYKQLTALFAKKT